MTNVKSYQLADPNQFDSVAWVSAQELWVTQYGILTDRGMRDHFGPNAVKEALKVATRCDHLRFNHRNNSLVIANALNQDGLNLGAHPFKMNCLMGSMWRFCGLVMNKTLPEYGDADMFYGWMENLAAAVCKRDGEPYSRPGNMFGASIYLDH
jgi:hypothetical protein